MFPNVSGTENRGLNAMVFLFDCGIRSIICCRTGEKHWTYVSYAEEIDAIANNENYFKDTLVGPVFLNGCLYAETFGASAKIVSICEIDEPMHIDIKEYCDQPFCGGITVVHGRLLVEAVGELFRIHITAGGVRYNEVAGVEVFKLDQVKLSWNKVTDDAELDQVSFFITDHCAFSCQITNIEGEIKGGLVYLRVLVADELKEGHHYFGAEDINHYIFNIQENNLSMFLPNLMWKIPTSCDQFIWVMPDLSLGILHGGVVLSPIQTSNPNGIFAFGSNLLNRRSHANSGAVEKP
ncbi:hypothetical protein HS088_TW09G01069 [Tripterygium wilfordii]|uniref:KIB1-4 beta-propeller domain-containing protein n=1 Tax=Tripterygium wilfordii TaxID=458696 RepID=A0A7J7D9H9_TRIWF|nr:hypothetical protein HS088_TW09G01069 [Tripterygium wilfordii]